MGKVCVVSQHCSDFETSATSVVMKPSPTPSPNKDVPDMLRPYIGLKINPKAMKNGSSYVPSSLMMDYKIHQINNLLVDNRSFRRACPSYHPYILRLYYGVLFWIQCMRASLYAGAIDSEAHETLTFFLDAFPPESLPISSPLLGLFKTLSCSQPEIPTYGKIYPAIPFPPGPNRRDKFILHESHERHSYVMPNLPGIFALLEDLNAELSRGVIPAKGKHIPVNDSAEADFGHHHFPAPAKRSDWEKWALDSSGLQYPCEADKKLNGYFAERYQDFDFPSLAADDDLSSYVNFLHIKYSLAWFAQVRDIAAVEASFFKGSGTLADCAPFGIAANQVVVQYAAPACAPTPPMYSADPAGLFPFSVRIKTSARSLLEMDEAMAATFQTNVDMPPNHPFLNGTEAVTRKGAFWEITPVEQSDIDETSYLSFSGITRGLMKTTGLALSLK